METNPTTTTDLQLFDSKGRYQHPSVEAVATLSPEVRERFAAVQTAATASEAATENRVNAEQALMVELAERDAAEVELRRVRPKISHNDLAKEWIKSQRAL